MQAIRLNNRICRWYSLTIPITDTVLCICTFRTKTTLILQKGGVLVLYMQQKILFVQRSFHIVRLHPETCNNGCSKFLFKVYKAKQKTLAVSHWCPQFPVLKELTQHFTALSNYHSIVIEPNKIFPLILNLNVLNPIHF